MNPEQLAETMLRDGVEPFRPYAEYIEDGDCLEFFVSNDMFRAEIVDGWLTLYYSERTDCISGGLVKGVRNHLMRKFPGVRFRIIDNKAEVTLLLELASLASSGDELVHRTYQSAMEAVSEIDELSAELVSA